MAIALYARKSVERENSISCETQIEYCRAMIKPDERSEKVQTFVDNGFSGGNTDRDGFQKMMRQVERGKISKVIIYRIDRISRSLSDFVGILETFKAHGVELVSSQESFDTSSPYGEMIVKLLVVFAEFERKSTIERVTQAYQHRSDLGIYMGGRQPYGFTLTDTVIHGIKTKMLEPLETEVEQVRYIFDSYASGGISLRRLMDNLVQNSILPTEGSWSTAKLSAILKNPVYVRADNAVYEYYAKQGTRIVSEITEFDGIHGLQLYGKTTHKAEDWSDMKVVVMAKVNLLKNRLTEIRQAEEKLVDLILGGDEPDMIALLNQRAQKLAEEKREVGERMEALYAESTEVIHAVSLSGRWKKATYEERRSVCQLLIHQIRMDADGGAEVVWNI
jgi:DNA invertase Pin-like site-specific DNA recombinase